MRPAIRPRGGARAVRAAIVAPVIDALSDSDNESPARPPAPAHVSQVTFEGEGDDDDALMAAPRPLTTAALRAGDEHVGDAGDADGGPRAADPPGPRTDLVLVGTGLPAATPAQGSQSALTKHGLRQFVDTQHNVRLFIQYVRTLVGVLCFVSLLELLRDACVVCMPTGIVSQLWTCVKHLLITERRWIWPE